MIPIAKYHIIAELTASRMAPSVSQGDFVPAIIVFQVFALGFRNDDSAALGHDHHIGVVDCPIHSSVVKSSRLHKTINVNAEMPVGTTKSAVHLLIDRIDIKYKMDFNITSTLKPIAGKLATTLQNRYYPTFGRSPAGRG